MDEKKTVYQELNNLWKKNHPSEGSNVVDLKAREKEVLLSTSSKEEYDIAKKQAQQTDYLKKLWKKGGRQLILQAQLSESLRIPSYIDYNLMSQHEIIGRALEIYTEEALVPNNKGEILTIFSEDEKVQKELEYLFKDVLNVHVNIPSWTHELVKKGDCMVNLDLEDVNGIVGCRILPTSEIERIDANSNDIVINRVHSLSRDSTVFHSRVSGQTYNQFSICHFRLLLDQQRLPYGSSILEKCRRVWRNLVLAEDAMLSAHLQRGVDRLIHNVDVGNIDQADVDAYMEELASRYKRKIKVDANGNVDHQYNIMGIDQDYFIPNRGNKGGSSIEKLEGQTTINTNVVDYYMKKLMAALGIPLTYISYSETAGEGKSLAMQDIRFAKTIIRIQQAIVQELNKMAAIHLVLVGMKDQIGNFMLSMTNPSMQSDILQTELLAQKMDLYNAATDNSSGIAPYSVTKAKKEILGMSEKEIIEDIKRVRIETAVKQELDRTQDVIPVSGIFDDVDAIYGSVSNVVSDGENSSEEDSLGGLGGGGGSSGGLGGGLDSELDALGDDTGELDDTSESNMEEDIDITDDNLEERVLNTLNKLNKLIKG